MPSKKKAPSANIDNEASKLPVFTGRTMNKVQIGKLRMRARDILADNVKNILNEEMKTQEAALEAGVEFEGTLTLNTTDLDLMESSMKAAAAQYAAAASAATKESGTYKKFQADMAVEQKRIEMCRAGQLKALSPEEKVARAAELELKMAQLADLEAELSALRA